MLAHIQLGGPGVGTADLKLGANNPDGSTLVEPDAFGAINWIVLTAGTFEIIVQNLAATPFIGAMTASVSSMLEQS